MMAAKLEGLELQRQYTPSLWSRRLPPEVIVDRHVQILSLATTKAQRTLPCEVAVCYDQESKQTLDIYYPTQLETKDGMAVAPANPTILLYFHGGYWSALGTEHSGFFAENCSAEGILLVAVGYDLAPKVTMTTIVDQCRRAIAYVYKRFPGCRLFVSGHSAGGHLSACMLYTNWCEYGIETQPLSGAVLLCGIYDLRPIQRSHVNKPLSLTDEEVLCYSPLKNLERIRDNLPVSFPCLMAVGGDESDEFQRQGKEFHQGLLSVGAASTNLTLPEHDHFIMNENLLDGDNSFTRDVITFILSNIKEGVE